MTGLARAAVLLLALAVVGWQASAAPARALAGAKTGQVAPAVTLSVAPVPTAANRAPGTPIVTWSTGDGSPGEVTVTSEGGSETLFAADTSGSSAAPWITADRQYLFRLYATGSGRRLLAKLKVGDAPAAAEIVAVPKAPRNTSAVVNRLLQALPFAVIAILLLLAMLYVREVIRPA